MGIRGFEFPHHMTVSVQTVVDEDPDLAESRKQAGEESRGRHPNEPARQRVTSDEQASRDFSPGEGTPCRQGR